MLGGGYRLNSRQRYVLILSGALMVPFIFLTSIKVNDFGVFVSSYTMVYFALRIVFNPKLRLRVDVLGLFLLVAFALLVAQQVLGVH